MSEVAPAGGVKSYFGTGGQQVSVTRERIRQIEAKTPWKLKHPSPNRKLQSVLDN